MPALVLKYPRRWPAAVRPRSSGTVAPDQVDPADTPVATHDSQDGDIGETALAGLFVYALLVLGVAVLA